MLCYSCGQVNMAKPLCYPLSPIVSKKRARLWDGRGNRTIKQNPTPCRAALVNNVDYNKTPITSSFGTRWTRFLVVRGGGERGFFVGLYVKFTCYTFLGLNVLICFRMPYDSFLSTFIYESLSSVLFTQLNWNRHK